MYNFSDDIVSDLHKDAWGFRPTSYWMGIWESSTDDEKQALWDELVETMDRHTRLEKLREEEAIEEIKSMVNLNIALGSGDRKTALRWMTQTEKFYNEQDVEHWVWKQGVLFTDYGKALVKELMEIVEFEQVEY